MVDQNDDQKLTDFERFMASVEIFNTQVNAIPLGELLCTGKTQYEFTEDHPDGFMLATFTIHHDGQSRPTNYTGMIRLLRAARTVPPDQEEKTGSENQVATMLTIGYVNNNGYQELKFPLRNLHRLMSHPSAMGSHRFCIRNNILVKEEKTRNDN
ncbi:MAG: hypothetical protein V1668_05030 [Patescibacteria group bacterium]